MSELTSKNVYLSSHKKGMDFDASLAEFINKTSRLVQTKCSEDELVEFLNDLGAAKGEAASFLYFTRRERDKALGNAYLKYPKKIHNSEEQNALARQASSAEIRQHELIKELIEAINTRIGICRQQLQMRQLER